jgi:hypothetical protein
MEVYPNDIIQALHSCHDKKCEECIYHEYEKNTCMKYLFEDAAEYIESSEKEKG